MLRYTLLALGVAVVLSAAPISSQAQPSGAMSDSDYMAKIATAAPPSVVKGATIVQAQSNGSMRTLQTGSNGFTCMLILNDPMCADSNAMEWGHAYMSHTAPPDKVGFAYMLAGDNGASNTDPYASGPTADNHWIKTGPHVMILGPVAKTMGYPMSADPDVTKPYVMWSGTPYAHVMIPVSSPQ
jgi:hypothetical protein